MKPVLSINHNQKEMGLVAVEIKLFSLVLSGQVVPGMGEWCFQRLGRIFSSHCLSLRTSHCIPFPGRRPCRSCRYRRPAPPHPHPFGADRRWRTPSVDRSIYVASRFRLLLFVARTEHAYNDIRIWLAIIKICCDSRNPIPRNRVGRDCLLKEATMDLRRIVINSIRLFFAPLTGAYRGWRAESIRHARRYHASAK